MKHNHAEMIKAWADNAELVVFYRIAATKWERVEARGPAWSPSTEYFMCLPKHEEACLNSLNGGAHEVTKLGNIYPTEFKNHKWDATCWYMDKACNSRIKPKKEKRWTAIDIKSGDVHLCSEGAVATPIYQIIEIEVEVG